MNHRCKFTLFWAVGQLKFLSIDVLEQIPKRFFCNKHVVIIYDHYWKLTTDISTAIVTSKHVTTLLFYRWVLSYCIRNYILPESHHRFVSKYYTTLCDFLGLENSRTTVHNLLVNSQACQYNRALVTRFLHYAYSHLRDWGTDVQRLI